MTPECTQKLFANKNRLAAKQRAFPSCGGVKGDRTPDLIDAIDALSQLSYDPASWRDLYRTPPSLSPLFFSPIRFCSSRSAQAGEFAGKQARPYFRRTKIAAPATATARTTSTATTTTSTLLDDAGGPLARPGAPTLTFIVGIPGDICG